MPGMLVCLCCLPTECPKSWLTFNPATVQRNSNAVTRSHMQAVASGRQRSCFSMTHRRKLYLQIQDDGAQRRKTVYSDAVPSVKLWPGVTINGQSFKHAHCHFFPHHHVFNMIKTYIIIIIIIIICIINNNIDNNRDKLC